MSDQLNPDQFDDFAVLKPGLYMGMLLNVLAPAVYFFLIYYFNSKCSITACISGDTANMLFYVFVFLALCLIAAAYILRERLFKKPLIRTVDGADLALAAQFKTICIICGGIIESIAILGVMYFFLTARFQEGAILILISAGAYQLIRPRPGVSRRFIETQVELFNRGDRPAGPDSSPFPT